MSHWVAGRGRRASWIGDAPTREIEGETAEVRREDLRGIVGRERAVLPLVPQAIGDAGRGAPGTAAALVGGGARDALRHERREAGRRIVGWARRKPESTTMRTPSMVSDVSAIEVASTILRRPGATARWRDPARRA